MSAIYADGVSKRFGDVSVLESLSFDVEDGEVFGLLGPNGAGKTTTINVLTGVIAPDDGTVEVLECDPAAEPTRSREGVGILPEKEAPPSFLTPREYFAFVADLRGMPEENALSRGAEWADRLDFEDKLDTLCKDLSRGQQQKVMLTQAFLHEPDLVFIDEPLANLDPVMQDVVKEFVGAYNDTGNTIVLSTHHLEVAEELCTRVGILYDGELAAEHAPDADESLREAFKRTVTDEAVSAVQR